MLCPALVTNEALQRWSGTYFTKTTLKGIGLRIQLNHSSRRCTAPVPAHVGMRILHNNGIHDVALDYCGCDRAVPKHIQLLRRGLYPASQVTPKTCATFQLLKLLHLLALTSKGSTYDFYRMLEKSTNNLGINLPKSRYKALLRLVLQWRHLKMLKRGGRGNHDTGVEGTRDGELAILCPSCPHPGINLPPGWDEASPAMRFLYLIICCIDANFRLKNQLVSKYSVDPGLGVGASYMVPREPYEEYVLSRASDADVRASSPCTLPHTNHASSRLVPALASPPWPERTLDFRRACVTREWEQCRVGGRRCCCQMQ